MFMYLRFWLKLADTRGTYENLLKENKTFICNLINISQTTQTYQIEAEGLRICLDTFDNMLLFGSPVLFCNDTDLIFLFLSSVWNA